MTKKITKLSTISFISALTIVAQGGIAQAQNRILTPLPPLPPRNTTNTVPNIPNSNIPAIPAQRATASSSSTDYTLGAGDRVRLDIFQVDEYSKEYPVLVDGTISLPLVGRLKVDGLTVRQTQDAVARKYSTYLKRPLVTVGLVAPRPLRIGISGEVDNAGSYEIPLNADSPDFPSITDIIEKAGGITTLADVRNVYVTRKVGQKQTRYVSDLWSLLTRGGLEQDMSLRDGDTIFVPTVAELRPEELERLSEASFGIQTDEPVKVAISGEIKRPGSHTIDTKKLGGGDNLNGQEVDSLPPRLSLAIDAAGGLEPLANLKDIKVRRRTWDGQEKLIAVNLWDVLSEGDTEKDIILQEGDSIVIPKATALSKEEIAKTRISTFNREFIKVSVVGEVVNKGQINIRPNTPLNQALLTAGGFDVRRANQETVQLVRLNTNGTVTQKEIEVDFSANAEEENNPILQENDVIIVGRSGFTGVTDKVSPVGGVLGILRWLLPF